MVKYEKIKRLNPHRDVNDDLVCRVKYGIKGMYKGEVCIEWWSSKESRDNDFNKLTNKESK